VIPLVAIEELEGRRGHLQDDSAAPFVIEVENRVQAEDFAEQMERGVVVIEDKGEAKFTSWSHRSSLRRSFSEETGLLGSGQGESTGRGAPPTVASARGIQAVLTRCLLVKMPPFGR
jgi:hypothetical protein